MTSGVTFRPHICCTSKNNITKCMNLAAPPDHRQDKMKSSLPQCFECCPKPTQVEIFSLPYTMIIFSSSLPGALSAVQIEIP
ncbi:Protein of unknown function [Gryllus bimaculatus]|nr:Protein of unknown function [Gryllus bimaculatus]